MSIENIKQRAEAVEDDTKIITIEEAYEIAVRSQDDVPKLLAVVTALDKMAGCWLDGHTQDHHYGRMIRSVIAEVLAEEDAAT